MISINTPKVVSNTQTFKFRSVAIDGPNGAMEATLIFNVFGDNDQHLGEEIIRYTGADFDAFWAGFTSGKFLYEQLVAKKELGIQVPNDVENEFKGAE